MKSDSDRRPGTRAGLSRELVLRTARSVVEEQTGTLSIRAVARELGVAPNAIYSYFEDKTALCDALLDDVLGDVYTPKPDMNRPIDGVVRMMTSTYEVLSEHPALVPLYLQRQGARGENALRLGEILDALLVRGGVHQRDVADARRVLITYVIGFAAFRTGADGSRPGAATHTARTFSSGLRWLLKGLCE
jgi:TetR/AcrR family tetracycline transcriptional repressor